MKPKSKIQKQDKPTLPRKGVTFYGDDPDEKGEGRTEYRFSTADQLGNVQIWHWKKGHQSVTTKLSPYEVDILKEWLDRVVAYTKR